MHKHRHSSPCLCDAWAQLSSFSIFCVSTLVPLSVLTCTRKGAMQLLASTSPLPLFLLLGHEGTALANCFLCFSSFRTCVYVTTLHAQQLLLLVLLLLMRDFISQKPSPFFPVAGFLPHQVCVWVHVWVWQPILTFQYVIFLLTMPAALHLFPSLFLCFSRFFPFSSVMYTGCLSLTLPFPLSLSLARVARDGFSCMYACSRPVPR